LPNALNAREGQVGIVIVVLGDSAPKVRATFVIASSLHEERRMCRIC